MSDNFDQVWMTYDDAAKALGIKRSSVQRRAALRKWPKRMGNGKKVQVGIPPEAIPERTHEATPAPTPAIMDDNSQRIAVENAGLKVEVTQLKERLDEARLDNAKLLHMITEFSKPQPSFWDRIWNSRK